MKKYLILILTFYFHQQINAQYTDIINSKRPGTSESPYGIGTDVLQIETGLFYGHTNSEETFARVDPRGASLFLRYSKFQERFEINSQIIYQQNKLQFNNVFTSATKINGISEFNVGIKYLIYQRDYIDQSQEIRSWKKRTQYDKNRWVPSIGIYIGVNTNWVSTDYKESGMTPRVAILLQNNLSDRLNIITNFGGYKINSNSSVYTYIITATYAMNELLSIFVENQGDLSKSNPNFQIGTGMAYLYSKDLQFDLSGRFHLDDVNSGFIVGLGAAWRLDRHKDTLMEANQNGSKSRKNKNGFFSGLFKKNKK